MRASLSLFKFYYEVVFELYEANLAAIVGHYIEKFNEVAAQKNRNKASE